MKKKLIISEVILVFLAAACILAGVFYNSITELFSNGVDPLMLTDNDIGKTYTFDCTGNFLNEESDFFLYYGDEEFNRAFYVTVPSSMQKDFEYCCIHGSDTYKGTVRKTDADQEKKTYEKLKDYYLYIDELMDEFEYTDEMDAEVRASISSYYIELVSIDSPASDTPRCILYVAGMILLLAAVIRLISALTKVSAVKLSLGIAGVLAVIVLVICAITFNKLRSVFSIKTEGDGLYSMTCYGDMKVDELLEANVTSTEELIQWIADEQFYGYPLEYDEENLGCAAFVCKDPDGDVLFGRNFDYYETDAVMVYTAPDNGYASYSMVDLTVLGVGKQMIDTNSNSWLLWKSLTTETTLPQGWAPQNTEYSGPNPSGSHVDNLVIYVVALKTPVDRLKGAVNGANTKFEEFITGLDTDSEGNTGNIIAYGVIAGTFT